MSHMGVILSVSEGSDVGFKGKPGSFVAWALDRREHIIDKFFTRETFFVIRSVHQKSTFGFKNPELRLQLPVEGSLISMTGIRCHSERQLSQYGNRRDFTGPVPPERRRIHEQTG
ncbi:hypothetical protein [Aminivibrio sp.]|uniref:hypothetical protein n=1 Tax=Aminivibrio sp. TaxID=1872489 RepID=UPI003D98F253